MPSLHSYILEQESGMSSIPKAQRGHNVVNIISVLILAGITYSSETSGWKIKSSFWSPIIDRHPLLNPRNQTPKFLFPGGKFSVDLVLPIFRRGIGNGLIVEVFSEERYKFTDPDDYQKLACALDVFDYSIIAPYQNIFRD